MNKAYIRCNGGHYFTGEYCPYDGWSSDESKQLSELTSKIESDGKKLSLEELKEMGAAELILSKTLIISFGEGNFVFDAVSPESYVIDGKYHLITDLPN